MSEPHAENDADAGLLLHELRNVNDVVYNIDSEIFDELLKGVRTHRNLYTE